MFNKLSNFFLLFSAESGTRRLTFALRNLSASRLKNGRLAVAPAKNLLLHTDGAIGFPVVVVASIATVVPVTSMAPMVLVPSITPLALGAPLAQATAESAVWANPLHGCPGRMEQIRVISLVLFVNAFRREIFEEHGKSKSQAFCQFRGVSEEFRGVGRLSAALFRDLPRLCQSGSLSS